MAWQSGGGGLIGVTTDANGNMTVVGAVIAGDDAAAAVPTKHRLAGEVTVYGGDADDVDGDVAVTGITGRSFAGTIVVLQANSFSQAGQFIRRGVSNGHTWNNPVVLIADQSDDTSESSYVLQVDRANATVLGVDEFGLWASQPYHSDLGIGVFRHSPPATQPLLATGAGHTVDDVISLLQSYGFAKQS